MSLHGRFRMLPPNGRKSLHEAAQIPVLWRRTAETGFERHSPTDLAARLPRFSSEIPRKKRNWLVATAALGGRSEGKALLFHAWAMNVR